VKRLALARPRVWAAIIGAVALLVRLPFLFDPRPVLQPDSLGYLGIADSVVNGHGLGDDAVLRPLGYPIFLVVLRIFPGDTASVIVTAQHLIGVALAMAILLVAWRFFGRTAGIVAGTLAAISPQLIYIEHEVLSDYLFLVVAFAGIVSLAFFAHARSWRLLLIPGLLFGLATVTKPLGQCLVVVAPIALLFLLPRWKPALRAILLVTLGMALVLVPWVVRNDLRHGHAVVSSISDQVLFWRVFDGNDPLPFVGHDPATEKVRKFYDDYRSGRSPTAVTVWYVNDYLRGQGYTQWEAGAIERKIAMKAIRADPTHFAQDSLNHLDDFARTPGATGTYDSVALLGPKYKRSVRGAPGIVADFEGKLIAWPVIRLAPYLTAIWWLLSAFGFAGLVLLRSRDPVRRTGAVVVTTALVVLGLALALTGLPDLRYNVVGAPLLWILGSAGLVPVYGAIYRWGWTRTSSASSASPASSAHAS